MLNMNHLHTTTKPENPNLSDILFIYFYVLRHSLL